MVSSVWRAYWLDHVTSIMWLRARTHEAASSLNIRWSNTLQTIWDTAQGKSVFMSDHTWLMEMWHHLASIPFPSHRTCNRWKCVHLFWTRPLFTCDGVKHEIKSKERLYSSWNTTNLGWWWGLLHLAGNAGSVPKHILHSPPLKYTFLKWLLMFNCLGVIHVFLRIYIDWNVFYYDLSYCFVIFGLRKVLPKCRPIALVGEWLCWPNQNFLLVVLCYCRGWTSRGGARGRVPTNVQRELICPLQYFSVTSSDLTLPDEVAAHSPGRFFYNLKFKCISMWLKLCTHGWHRVYVIGRPHTLLTQLVNSKSLFSPLVTTTL